MTRSPFIADTVLMVRPTFFSFNEETAESNAFQNKLDEDPLVIRQRAMEEYHAFVLLLQNHGIQVLDVEDFQYPHTPDAVFPNNWFHTDFYNKRVLLYPMLSAKRQLERRPDIIAKLQSHTGFSVEDSLLDFENQDLALEGTGSLIMDHEHRIAYAALSPRTSAAVLESWSKLTDYQVVSFTARGPKGEEIYHTNVMMTMADEYVVIAMDSIPSQEERNQLQRRFVETNKEILEISLDQMNNFAGNMLQLQNSSGDRFLVMSHSAYKSLEDAQIQRIRQFDNTILHPDLTTIETIGGGSARCMLGEVYSNSSEK